MENKRLSPITLTILVLVIVIGGIWVARRNNDVTPASEQETKATTKPVEVKSYKNEAHQFELQYTSDWKETDLFVNGLYKDAVAFVRVDKEAEVKSKMKPDSDTIASLAKDNVLFFRIVKNTSINSIIQNLYGSSVVVSNAKINGSNIAHIVHSKSTDPAGWSGGSTEAYIFRNSLGEAIVVEANYGTPEPDSESELSKQLNGVLPTLKFKAL